jgi:hypothetical protein
MQRSALVLLSIALAALTASAGRLQTGITPTHYDLWFAPDLEQAIFRGRATIRVTLDRPATSIALNAAEIAFERVTVEDGTGAQEARVSLDEAGEP